MFICLSDTVHLLNFTAPFRNRLFTFIGSTCEFSLFCVAASLNTQHDIFYKYVNVQNNVLLSILLLLGIKGLEDYV